MAGIDILLFGDPGVGKTYLFDIKSKKQNYCKECKDSHNCQHYNSPSLRCEFRIDLEKSFEKRRV